MTRCIPHMARVERRRKKEKAKVLHKVITIKRGDPLHGSVFDLFFFACSQSNSLAGLVIIPAMNQLFNTMIH